MNSQAATTLLAMKNALDAAEAERFSPFACLSSAGVRRREEAVSGHRQQFSLDADRILHSRAYTRYIDKTQVFYMVANDHITHRVLHVQLVSKIARTMGRFLGLNEDLIEAIALGHDIGHPPFGHDGERFLSELCVDHGLPPFQHNLQSVRFLDIIERQGRGWNLTLQTLDGIVSHDGEVHDQQLAPARDKDFSRFAEQLAAKAADPSFGLLPMTLEGCLVRFADTISYIGRDIEDAIELGVIARADIPADCAAVLGDTNGTIVYNLVADLITTSNGHDYIAFSKPVAEQLYTLKQFNYQRIYLNPAIKQQTGLIKACYQALFAACLAVVERDDRRSPLFPDFLLSMSTHYLETTPPALKVTDFIAGMTDDYFINLAAELGCAIPVQS